MKERKKDRKIKSLQGRVFRISLIGGLILGVVALLIGLGIYAVVLADQYITRAFSLNPGDTLLVYTDGVPEATDAHNELYGSERMIRALNENPEAAPEEVLAALKQSVDSFVGEAPQFDDLTMLCLSYHGVEQK